MAKEIYEAPGHPGHPAHWFSADKCGIGTALTASSGSSSLVWFTLARGVVSEVFYPRIDRPAIRELTLIVADGEGFVADETTDCEHEVAYLNEGVPVYRLINTCKKGRFRIEKTVLAHPDQNAILLRVRYEGQPRHVHVVVYPHLGGQGSGNTGWVGSHNGEPLLMARREGNSLALACSAPWLMRSAGFAGTSDGRTDLAEHGRMTWEYDRAENGNVALTGRVDLGESSGEFTLALGFGPDEFEAAHHARACLLDDFGSLVEEYTRDWADWQHQLRTPRTSLDGGRDLYRASTLVLRAHQDKAVPGATIASLSIPWGFAKGEDALDARGGYHLAWPRDLVMIAGGLVAAGANKAARRAFDYLRATQQGDGHWPQNMWASGAEFWGGLQLGETALPILLMDLLACEGILDRSAQATDWPMVRAAVGYIVLRGPATQQDRWENDQGYTPYTLGLLIAALLVAAEQADANDEPEIGGFLRETADAWNAEIERWLYVTGTELAERVGVEGYYVRIVPTSVQGDISPNLDEATRAGMVPQSREGNLRISEVVSPDALALVRFGLRAPDDPRIVNTVRALDAVTKVETPLGPCWHRYNGDGYGEHADGSPLNDMSHRGIGRAWPLLTGERAHYELAASHRDEAIRLLGAMAAFAGAGGLIPEQVWDTEAIPQKGLFPGRPTGSAMPLAWAHAEYVKLRRSLDDGRVFDMPPQTVQRYLVDRTPPRVIPWRPSCQRPRIPAGKVLRLIFPQSATVHWSLADGPEPDGREAKSHATGLGLHIIDLPTTDLRPGQTVRFRVIEPKDQDWSGRDFEVSLREEPQ